MNEEELANILRVLDNHEKKIRELFEKLKNLENTFLVQPSDNIKKMSIQEFFLTKSPKNDIQKTLLLCYYLEKYRDLKLFNVKDIENGFKNAKEKAPDNINYKVYMNIKKGYIMETNEKKDNLKSWTLTNSGVRLVDSDFIES